MDEIVSGIYQIRNTFGGKVYVGSAVNLERRKAEHFSNLRGGKHHSRHLQNAYNKYGENSFVFSVLEYCEKERLIEREQFYIDALQPGYNIAPIAGNTLGVRYTAEARAKLSAMRVGNTNSLGCKRSAETRAKMSAAKAGKKLRLGCKHTAETRAKMSIAQIGNKNNLGHKHTAETRAKISAARRKSSAVER